VQGASSGVSFQAQNSQTHGRQRADHVVAHEPRTAEYRHEQIDAVHDRFLCGASSRGRRAGRRRAEYGIAPGLYRASTPAAAAQTGPARADLTSGRVDKANPGHLCVAQGESLHAQVAELVDALVSGTSGESRGGSSPLLGTIQSSGIVRGRPKNRKLPATAQNRRRLRFDTLQIAASPRAEFRWLVALPR
jgi:hypothetical protein